MNEIGHGMVVGVALATIMAGCAGCGTATSARNPGLAALPAVPNALIRLQHGSCSSGGCPVYQVSIFADGTFVYDGLANVAQVGRRSGRLSVQQVNALLSEIETAGFLDQPSECCVCATTDGSHLVVVAYNPGETQKIVVHDERCGSAPAAIGAFEGAIARETAIARWVVGQAPDSVTRLQYASSQNGDSQHPQESEGTPRSRE